MPPQHTSQKTVTANSPCSSEAALHGFKRKQSSVVAAEDPPFQRVSCSTAKSDFVATDDTVTHRLPPNVDPEVFRLLPEEIQRELLSPAYRNSLASTSTSSIPAVDASHVTKNKSSHSFTDSQNINRAANKQDPSESLTTLTCQSPAGTTALSEENDQGEGTLSFPRSSDCQFPGNVDPKVFSELPPDVQKELMSEWKQQKPVLKTTSSRKPGKSSLTKDRKAAGKGCQANSLLKYFKPS